ncbi:beta-propeller fold lactonase family protein, partial [Pseudomonas sp. RL_5y_Pfl2_70]|uniref:beta-propeller fold lactonase family protein n=1 Tax=Pseudomonas sp. RL_5y_Pfl2_70 TaxID=3088712 RepID=UPI0030D9E249
DIPQDGFTVETAVTLTGTASKGQGVKILDGNTDKGDATADPVTGIWTKTVSGLGITPHSFTAKAVYGLGQVSDPWTLTVTPVVTQTIDKILDNAGKEIREGETTVSPTVTVSGTASKGQSIEIWEGNGATAVIIGTAIADRTTGIWEKTFPLALGPRRLAAKRLYPGTPLWSNVRLLTVVALVKPTIDKIEDAAGRDIPEGSTTTSTNVKLKGKASVGQQVEVFDGTGPSAESKGKATADASGDWELSIPVAEGPHRFAAQSLYHPNPTYSNVRTLNVFHSATIPVGNEPGGIVAHPDGSFVYVCNFKGDSVSVIDTASQTVIKTLSVGGEPPCIAVHPNGRFLYVTTSSPSSVKVIDTLSQTVITTITVGYTASGVAFHPDGSRVYVCNLFSHSVSVIDTLSQRVIKTITGLTSAFRIAVHPDGSRIYVAQLAEGKVSVIETLNHTVIKIIYTAQKPREVATHPDGSCVYVTDYYGDAVLVIDTRSLTVIKAIGVRSPTKVTFHPDGSRAYVCLYADKLVAVIDTQSHAVIKTVSVGQGPSGIAVHPDGIRLYVCDAPSSTVSVIPAE